MRLDYLTIFPDYLDPLRLSLTGKAIEQGLVEVHVHDLRDWAHDRHRTVDDAPYGGGAGMVMKPEPWGEAFDELGLDGATLVVPTPAGRPFTQALARDLAARRAGWSSPAAATRGSTSGSSTTRRRAPRSSRSRSATTCSTAARSPRSR